MRTLRGTLLLGMAALSPAPALAQEARELTPDEAVRLALEYNPRVRAVLADAAEAEAGHREARAARLPRISSQARYTRLSDNVRVSEFTFPGADTSVALLPMELNHYHLELSVEQPLFTGSRLTNEVRAAEHYADAAEWTVEGERAEVAFQTRRAYWRLYEAGAVREAVDAALAQVEEHLRDVRNRLDAGAALTSDLLSAETRLAEVRLERLEAENALRVARLELNRVTGLPLDTPVRPVGAPEVGPLPEDLDLVVSRALEGSPRLNALEGDVFGADARLRAAAGTRFPDVGLFGRYIHAQPNPYFLTEQDQLRGSWEVGVSMNWNVWDGGRRAARSGQARARLEAAESRLAEAREQTAVDITARYLEVRHRAEAVEVAAQNVRAAEESLRVVRQQYAEGVALSEQVLSAEQAYRTAQTERARSLAGHAIARAGLQNALGEVW